jgi:hypothetical protein
MLAGRALTITVLYGLKIGEPGFHFQGIEVDAQELGDKLGEKWWQEPENTSEPEPTVESVPTWAVIKMGELATENERMKKQIADANQHFHRLGSSLDAAWQAVTGRGY